MMGKTIVLPFGSSKQSRYTVNFKNAISSSSSGIKIKGATSCCNAEVGSKKYCKECGEEKAWKAERKMFKFDGKEHIFDADKFDEMIATIDNTDIEVKAILQNEPPRANKLYNKLAFATPAKKHEKEYAELKEVLKEYVLVVEFSERQNHHQGLLSVQDEQIMLRYLHDSDDLNEPVVQIEEEANGEVVELKRKILGKKATNEFDVMDFHSKRKEIEENFFDAIITGKEASIAKEEVVESKGNNELDELRALAE